MTVTRQSPAVLVWAASGWIALVGNLPLWRELDSLGVLHSAGGPTLALALAGVIAAAVAALLSVVAWRPTLKPLVVALLLLTAATMHFMLRYHVVIDSGMLTNALQTDSRETAALLDAGMLLPMVGAGVLPAWLVWRWPVRLAGWRSQSLRNAGMAVLALAAAAAFVMLSYQPLASAMRNHKQLRYLMNPLNSLYAAGVVASRPFARKGGPMAPLGADAKLAVSSSRPALFVLVLGETGRSGNFGLNGYPRATTPELAALGVASFRNAWSCGTSTAASVPCMFSHLGREAFNARAQDHENLLDVLQHAGLAVLWVDNQAGCKGVCDRVMHVTTQCGAGECPDESLLEGLDERIAALPAERRARGVVVVLHQMGSHGPAYWQRSPPAYKRFAPECRSVNLPDCSPGELLNAYDNSVVYTDHVLAATVRWLKAQQGHDTAMLYVADHGESLGENSLYLHGLPWALAPDVQKHVPWVTWLSGDFERRAGVAMDCLKGRADAPLTHDHLFHSVLGLLQVQTSAYRKDLDAYRGCGAD
ncbi:MAG: phosphoethanolamine--lipid A transferase [Burkholderiales bacterium]|nr:phosphoethanolamine--lipid A transferase [Burkholderiales bacterium]